MTITLQGLLAADTGRLEDIAGRWDRLARTFDTAVEDLGRDTRELPNHWPAGPSSQAAQDKAADLRVQVGRGQVHCAAIAWTIREFVLAIEHHRRVLQEVVAEAEATGLRVDLAAGLITAPIGVAATQPAVDGYARQIGEIVAGINDADRKAAGILGDNTFREEVVPVTEEPRYDDISILALANWTTPSQGDWWKGQHSLVQDRAIAEHPEIIGAARGLPPGDRDTANRLLLRRAKDEVLAARARQDEVHDGVMSRAQLDLDRRLSTITDLERRSEGKHLLSYEPGAEQEAELTKR
ncbi:hypothetical protein [Actinoplanes sp. M2I2]|uniref:hypothetical protein n=1 Tax=Actinoplanes sp. M2I2 TaxID=1734444 RepID=UPI0020214267|nr:hypothetical protein [Actinoplanes sp. M2I2]